MLDRAIREGLIEAFLGRGKNKYKVHRQKYC